MNAAASVRSLSARSPRARGIRFFNERAWDRAITHFDEALRETPEDPELHNYRARALEALGRPDEALQAIERALAMDPDNVADLRNRALLLRRLGRLPDALTALEMLLVRTPDDIDALVKRVHTLSELERREEALTRAEDLLRRHPDNPLALNARGIVLERLGRYDEALAEFDRMLAMRPGDTDAINNRGMIQARLGHWGDALASYDRSLSIEPQQPQAFYNRSLVRLSLGDWGRGLEEFEGRWETPPLNRAKLRLATPQWSGKEDLKGRSLFVYHEQGYGDTLQCARYIPRMMALGAKLIFAVPPAMRKLMETLDGRPEVITLGAVVPSHDFHCPLMSLMRAFGTTPQTIPATTAYLRADARKVLEWRRRLGIRRRPRIGVVWRGRCYPPVNYPRDVPFALLTPLFDLEADFVSLQTEVAESDRAVLGGTGNLDARSALGLEDFAETAALIESLDLVISVDTAVAHLAGVLGKPVWLLNRFASCWRWGQQGKESPWYPSMRIFRQGAVGDWTGVIAEVRKAASEFLGEGRGRADIRVGNEAPTSGAEVKHRPVSVSAARERSETFRFVCATRHSAEEFLAKSPLGRSLPLYRTFPKGQRIELRLFKENTQGLSTVYNIAIEEARDDRAILVFIHDDVFLSDYYWADHLLEGFREFDIVGIAGNRRRALRQASWMYLDDQFRRDDDDNLSGVLGHGEGFPNLTELSIYGEPCQECKLLDGVLLAVRSRTLIENELRFDPRFRFHFYDLDFCRQAEEGGLRMGTWALSIIHASAGKLGSPAWRSAYQDYLAKYEEL
ncbi:MAG: tetratricopeptide repeat protein [Candidatus Sulfotelmatobacter sp.]